MPVGRAHRLLTAPVSLLVVGVLAMPMPGALATDVDAARQRRQVLQEQVDVATGELELLGERIAETQAAVDGLSAHVAALTGEALRAEEALRIRAIAAYKLGTNDVLPLLLGADGTDVIDRARLLLSLDRRDRETIEQAAAARAAERSRRAELTAALDALEADQARAAELSALLDAELARAAETERVLVTRGQRQRRIDRPGQRGIYACPIAAPFRFRDTWGFPRSGGRKHKGTDVYGVMGAEVYAMTGGVVVRHSLSRLGGVGLYLRGDDGVVYYYAHLQATVAVPGQRVEAGDLVARNGDTGNAKGGAPHVHLQTHPRGGAPVNPYPVAAAACY